MSTALQFGLTPKTKPLSPKRSAMIAALDVGTSKVACLIARLRPYTAQDALRRRTHSIEVIGFGHTLARVSKPKIEVHFFVFRIFFEGFEIDSRGLSEISALKHIVAEIHKLDRVLGQRRIFQRILTVWSRCALRAVRTG